MATSVQLPEMPGPLSALGPDRLRDASPPPPPRCHDRRGVPFGLGTSAARKAHRSRLHLSSRGKRSRGSTCPALPLCPPHGVRLPCARGGARAGDARYSWLSCHHRARALRSGGRRREVPRVGRGQGIGWRRGADAIGRECVGDGNSGCVRRTYNIMCRHTRLTQGPTLVPRHRTESLRSPSGCSASLRFSRRRSPG